MSPGLVTALVYGVKAVVSSKAVRLALAREILEAVKRNQAQARRDPPPVAKAAVLVVFAASLTGCALAGRLGKDDCLKLRAAEALACQADPRSLECTEAGELLDKLCRTPAPPGPVDPPAPPTPEPPPVDPPPVTPPDTPAPAPGCVLAGSPTDPIPGHPMTPALGKALNAALHRLRPDCEPGGRCVIPASVRPQEWQRQVAAELRRDGWCAGQHEPDTDEIAAAATSEAPWEGFHVYAGAGWDDPTQGGTVLWSPQAYRGAWRPPASSPPTPDPGPAPVDPPPAVSCPAPLPPRTFDDGTTPRYTLNVSCWPTPERCSWLDGTPVIQKACGYCASIGMGEHGGKIRCTCPVRPDGHPDRAACEQYLTGGVWWQTDPPDAAVVLRDGNPYSASCVGCTRMRLCSGVACEVFSEWRTR
jgi:hypothetical protein